MNCYWKAFAAMSVIAVSLMAPQTICQHEASDYEQIFYTAQHDFEQGRLTAALVGFKKYLAYQPDSAVVHFNIGSVCAALGEHRQAIDAFTIALASQPHFASLAHFQRGHCLYLQGCLDQARDDFKQVVAGEPDHAHALAYLAKIELEQGNPVAAMPYAQRAAQLDGSYFDALMLVATELRDAYLFDEAVSCLRCAAVLAPDNYVSFLYLGDLYNLQKKMDDALAAYQQAYRLHESSYEAAHNIGMILLNKQEWDQAEWWLLHAAHLKSDFMWPHIGLSCLYLMHGDYARGWAEYEWRLVNALLPFVTDKPRWDGSALDGKTVLFYAEQGFGDTFHFIRYAQELKKKYSVRVIVLPQKQLVDGMRLCPYIDQVVGPEQPLPSFDCYASIMSLPYLCGQRDLQVPAEVPYLQARADLVEQWRTFLAADSRFKIGICWHVDPSHDCITYSHTGKKLQVRDSKRSIALQMLARLAQVPGVSLYSLQQFNGLGEIDDLSDPAIVYQFSGDFDQTNGRFMDTAAVIKNLDLVITVDTSVAHLAAALGKPTWILLPYAAEWRWLRERSDTPWYPTARLFRQQIPGDWESVMQQVCAQLQEVVAQYVV